MAGLRITLEGDKNVIALLNAMGERGHRLARKALQDSVEHVKNRAVEGIASGPKTGRVYDTYFFSTGRGFDRIVHPIGERPPHQASARGEYPASDTGNLMRSIWSEVDDLLAGIASEALDTQLSFSLDELVAAEGRINGYVGADAEYAVHLEYKDPSDGGRPFLRRALAESEDFIRERFLDLRGKIVP